MEKPKVAIVGCTGMLGSITLDSFVQSGEFDVIGTYRGQEGIESFIANYPDAEFRQLDAEEADADEIARAIEGASWVVNAVGIIKPYIHDDNSQETERAIRINGLFPYNLSEAAKKQSAKVIQIATDCVYSGRDGKYKEDATHDAQDVYGKTKSLGEAHEDNMYHVRCSIVGPELKGHLSLLDWLLGQEEGAELNGFTNHEWNGVTTLHFAKIAQGIIRQNIVIPHLQHIVPANVITKANLLRSFAKEFGRSDIVVSDVEAPTVIDRTLLTNNPALNQQIWQAAGYEEPPTIEQMVEELARHNFAGKASKQ